MPRRLLFVDDEPVIRTTLSTILEKYGYQVCSAGTVAEALQKITSQQFDVLISDLNIGNPGDGLTVVSAMRRTQPTAVTMILTGYPAFETALEAIRQQVDDYIVKPADIPALISTIESKLAAPPLERQFPPPKRVAMVLQEHIDRIESLWLASLETDDALARSPVPKEQRLQHLRGILQEIIRAAQTYSGEEIPEHKRLNERVRPGDLEGYTPVMLLTAFCLLRRVLARVVQENLLAVNLSYLVPDLARVNESLDEQAMAALSALADSAKAAS